MSNVFKETQIVMNDVYNLSIPPFHIPNSVTKTEKTVADEKSQVNIEEQYARLMSEIERRKSEILEKATQEADKLKEIAYEDGRRQGYNDGKMEAKLEYDMKLQEINEIKEEVIKEKAHLSETFEEDIINLVIKICERVFREDAAKLQDSISTRVKQALKDLNNIKDITLRVNREDMGRLSEIEKELRKMNINIDIIPEYRIAEGDFIIDTPNGVIDYSMAQALINMKNTLIEVLRNDRA